MQTNEVVASSSTKGPQSSEQSKQGQTPGISASLLTGCQDRPYAFGLAMALAVEGVYLDIIGSDDIDSPELHTNPNLRFLNLRGDQKNSADFLDKLAKLLFYYAKLVRYAAHSNPKILHILWNNKFELFDRTALMLYYKLCGKKIALTAHNVNQARRDEKDSVLNRLTLRIQYHLADHIFVHTQKMKEELVTDFDIDETDVTIIRHPINDAFPDTPLTTGEAKQKLGLRDDEKAILFFGRIRPYKGIERLLEAYQRIAKPGSVYRLILAGEPKKGSEEYLREVQQAIGRIDGNGRIVSRIEFIPDEDMELYLKAADVLVLPYKEIFQSGVLFLAYNFGLPVVAADVGSFREEIIEGKTGLLCKPGDVEDLANTIEKYFASDLYLNLKSRRQEIRDYARAVHSWEAVANLTRKAYRGMLEKHTS
jgi:D-inositol-3-phosphate glycosyltransferase